MNSVEIKIELYQNCQKYVDEKIEHASDAIENAQRSANEETKSSVGDKYETGRSMLQMERNKFEIQLKESLKLKEFLDQIYINKEYDSVQPGSLVMTETASFFIAINAGKQIVDGKEYYTISLASPVGQAITGKKVGNSFKINNLNNKIVSIA